MPILTQQEVLNTLQDDWATYVERFRGLTPEAQSKFLAEQGYARLADLLSHIIAWWEVGHTAVEEYLTNPQFQPPQYDVDAFNAEAVARASALDDDHVIESFEKMRVFLVEYVKALPAVVFENQQVVNQFNMDVVGHLSEHRLPE